MKSRTIPGRFLATVLATTALAAAACSSNSATGADSDPGLQVAENSGIVFLTQNVVHEATMDALFEGPVRLDERGCLRLDTPGADAPTAVWPLGYELSVEGDHYRVLDGNGELVGIVGGEFELGGGEVTELHDAMGFDQEDRDRAASRCPGRYWIVA